MAERSLDQIIDETDKILQQIRPLMIDSISSIKKLLENLIQESYDDHRLLYHLLCLKINLDDTFENLKNQSVKQLVHTLTDLLLSLKTLKNPKKLYDYDV